MLLETVSKTSWGTEVVTNLIFIYFVDSYISSGGFNFLNGNSDYSIDICYLVD